MYVLAAFTLVTFTLENANAQCGDEVAKADKTKIYAFTFHSDYCGACKALKTNVMELQTKLEDEPVEWVKFDFTSQDTKAKSEALAKELGVADLYKENQSTGYVLLVDADTKEQVGKLTSRQSGKDMYETLKNNL